MHAVKIACERPDTAGRSLSQWDCVEIRRQLIATEVVGSISVESVRLMLAKHRLKPWRHQMWLSAKVPRDAAFAELTRTICDLYTRRLGPHEMVLCVDEKTSLQPRTRKSPTRPAIPDQPVRVEHEYRRAGALNLFAAFDTRSGKVHGATFERKRNVVGEVEELSPPRGHRRLPGSAGRNIGRKYARGRAERTIRCRPPVCCHCASSRN